MGLGLIFFKKLADNLNLCTKIKVSGSIFIDNQQGVDMSDLDSFKLHLVSKTKQNIINNLKRIFAKAYMLEHQIKLNDALYHYHRVLELSNIHNLFHAKAHFRIAKINLNKGRPYKSLKYLRIAYLHNLKYYANSKKIFEDTWKQIIKDLHKSLDQLNDLKCSFKKPKAKNFVENKIDFFNKHVLIFESLPVKDRVLSVGVKKLKQRMNNALKNYKKQFLQCNNNHQHNVVKFVI